MMEWEMKKGMKFSYLRSTGKNGEKRNISNPVGGWKKTTLNTSLALTFAALCLTGPAMAQYNNRTERLDKIPDPVEVPSPAEIDALEAKAKAGDWALKQQFAAAYLYEHQKNQYWNWGCHHLQNGHVCRAMATRTESGEHFLREIIDLGGNGPVDKNTLARFQSDFAHRRVFDARPDYSPQHPACQEAVHYYERAVENEFAYWGKSCVAGSVFSMISHGQCFEKDEKKAEAFGRLNWGCPQF